MAWINANAFRMKFEKRLLNVKKDTFYVEHRVTEFAYFINHHPSADLFHEYFSFDIIYPKSLE